MGKTYNSNKLVLVSNRTTKNQLAEQVAKLVTEVADIMVERNTLRVERDALKTALTDLGFDAYHLSIQLDVAKEKIEQLKHNNRNLTNFNHELDSYRYALAGNQIFRNSYDHYCPKPVVFDDSHIKEAIKDFPCMRKTFLQKLFDYFQI